MPKPLLVRPLPWACILLFVGGRVVRAQDPWQQADLRTRRLPPSAFPEVPATVRADLERRGCTIPQLWSDSKTGNVIHGHFRRAGQVDWAVLCSVNRTSTILVYWSARSDSVDQLAPAPDKDFLQGVGEGKTGFSRAIAVVDASYIREHFEAFGGPEPPPIDHEGIDDAFAEKGSTVRYWYQGRWLVLTGAD